MCARLGITVNDSGCPFCRLVVRTFLKANQDIRQKDEARIAWNVGPGTRRFLSVSGPRDAWIGFGRNADQVAPEGDNRVEDTETRLNYCVEPVTGSILDTDRVLGCISSCERTHGSICKVPTSPAFSDTLRGLEVLRLVDVDASCLVEKRNRVRYIALSYVWGAVPNFRLTKANRTALLTSGSLRTRLHLLPATIQDAMRIVQRLGCRYLWVDALRLLQNDSEDMDHGVNAMDLIYERAWMTIAAACDHDADARLSGVEPGTRESSRNTVEIKTGVNMGIVTGLDTLLKRAVYDSRAWT